MPRRLRRAFLPALLGAALCALAAGALGIAAAPASANEQWQDPATLSDGTRSALGVAVADAAQAAPFAAWQEWDGTSFSIYAARFANGAWSAPTRLSRGPVQGGTVRMAASPAGAAIVIWRADGDQGVEASIYGNGAWGEPVRIAGADTRSARVTMEPDGSATVIWTERDDMGTRRVRAVRLAGDTAGEPSWISPAGQPVQPIAYIAGGRSGRVHAVWVAVRNGADTIEVAGSANGVWAAPATWSNPARNADLPRIAASRDGDVAVVWTEAQGDLQVPFARLLDNGQLRAAEALAAGAPQIPQIAVAAGGAERLVVAWTALAGDDASVQVASLDPQGWQRVVAITGADSPQVAMAAGGRAVLAYRVLGEGLDAIVVRLGIDGTWADPTQIGTTGAMYGPRVTVGPRGTPTVIWTAPGASGGPDVTMAARELSHLIASPTPHIAAVVQAIRDMERRTGSDSSEGLLWEETTGNTLDGAGGTAPGWLVRTQDCWGRTDVCSSGAVQQRMLDTIRSIIANATTTVDVSSLAGIADGGFREALIAGVREADAAGRRPVVRMVWGHQPAAPFSVRKLRNLHRDLEKAAPNLQIVLALHKNTLGLSGFSWNHSKIVAADGKVAYSSGINMWSDSYLQSTNPVTDVGVVVRGPGAVSAQRFLDVLWTELCTYPTWSVKHSNTLVPENGGANCPSRRAPTATAPVGEVTVLGVGRAGYIDTGRVAGTRDPREVSKADRSDSGCKLPPLPNTMNGDPKWDGDNPSDTALRALVESAEKRIVIGQQEAIFSCAVDPSYDVRLFDALARKVVDGVPVTIVVSNEKGAISTFEGYSSDPPSTMAVMRKRVRKLVASDAAATKAICSSLTIARFRYSNADTWPSGNQPALHGKVIAVDDAAFYVGSQNAYPNQLQEFGYIIEDPAAMADFKRDYLDPMVQYSSRAALSCDGAPTVPSAWRTGVLDRITPGSDVAVSLGDSFISGEAGRWNGNVGKKGNFGLIDAGANAYWDTATGESEAKCHRSKSAEIHIDGITGVNIACSGAITTSKSNLVGDWKPGIDRGVNGTDKYGQLTLLDAVAKRAEVKLVVLSIGGNDMGFSKIILACVAAFARPAPLTTTCQKNAGVQQKLSDEALAAVGNKVQGAIERINGTMRNAGYAAGEWKLIVQGYPMPIATAMRYPETYKGRFDTGGCPFYDSDVTWIGTRIPVLNAQLRAATQRAAKATGQPVEFMDIETAFAGRALCAKTDDHVDQLPAGPTRVSQAERVSMLRTLSPFQAQEAIHPNALGQIALQACLQLAWNGGAARSGTCTSPLDWTQVDAANRPLMRFSGP